MRRFDSHVIKTTVMTPDGVKYGSEAIVTEELADYDGMDIVSTEAYKNLVKVLNEAYDSVEFHHGEPGVTNRLERELLWEKVKNINTDEELEEIRQILRVKNEDL